MDRNGINTETRPQQPRMGSGRLRSASMKFLESSPPMGMWDATGNALAQAPTPGEIRRGSFSHNGWDGPIQRRNSTVSDESVRRLSRTNSAQTPASLGRSASGQQGPQAAMKAHAEADDEDHPFDSFFGRGEMSDQSYVPRSKGLPNKFVDPMEDDAPPFQTRKLPKKFTDPDEGRPMEKSSPAASKPTQDSSSSPSLKQGPDADGVYPTGYKFPPKHTWGEATTIGLKAFWKFTITPLGFLIVLYGLNVVAWGGMLFLLLIGGGSQYMCYPAYLHGIKACNDLYAPRRIWIETDSQILNALFCVTGFGLIPWRFRDLYYLLQYRVRGQHDALRKLAGIHRGWFRLPGSTELPVEEVPLAEIEGAISSNRAIPVPTSKAPDPPLTGIRAPPTKLWKLDYVIWAYVLNTFLQVVLSGFMWGLNRFDRPSWSTGLFVALACIVAALGGLMCFQEGKKVKKVEGIPVKEEEMLEDVERGVEGANRTRKTNGGTGGKNGGFMQRIKMRKVGKGGEKSKSEGGSL